MEILKNCKIDFLRYGKVALSISALFILFSFLLLAVRGLNLGLDFTGGVQLDLQLQKAMPVHQISKKIHQVFSGPNEVRVNRGDSYTVRIPGRSLELKRDLDQGAGLAERVNRLFPEGKVSNLTYVGAVVSNQIAASGILIVIIAILAITAYIAMRFERRLAFSAALAILHDPILILGFFSLTQLPFDLVTLAALLTVIGYSLNDTVVVFDRIRENFRLIERKMDLAELVPKQVINNSINQTLSRTSMLSGMTLTLLLVLLFFGGSLIFEFSLALIIGIIVGTYSSIYVAGFLAYKFGLNHQMLKPKRQLRRNEV